MRRLFVIAAAAAVAACSSGGGGNNNGGTTPTAATPTFSVAAGTKDAPISVTISEATAGATIHYTTNGADPTPASSTYAGAIAISTATTLKAIATASGYSPSAVASAAYTFQAATPTFSVAPGTYLTAQEVALASATPGASLHYTLDGSTPTASSPSYAGTPIPLSADPSTTTIQVIAVLAGFTDSAVASATYTIDSAATPTATPTFSPGAGSYATAQDVTIACATAGATIYYTTDGSAPTTGSTVYAGPVHVASSATLKAVAAAPGHTTSAVGFATYTITAPPPQAATPTFSPTPGSYPSAQSVTISCASAGATIHYTTDGSTPTEASTTYGGAITVSATTTLKAIATGASYTPSAVATATYTITAGGGGGSDFLTFCAAMNQRFSDLLASCFKMNPDFLAALGGIDDCAAAQKEITAGLVTYSAAAASTCTADAAAMTCASMFAGGGSQAPSSCGGVLTGTVANGSAVANQCYSSDDCANGWCTSEMTSACPGFCQAFATSGQDCSNAECAPGLFCHTNENTSAQTCVTPSALNGPCPCQEGLWCDPSGATPVCKAPLTAGATCSPSYGAAECAVGLTCFNGHCTALVGNGGACTALAGGASACGPGYYCPAGTCTGKKASGSCGATATYSGPAPECMSGVCMSGQCYPISASTTCSMP